MNSRRSVWMAVAMAPVLAAFLAAPLAASAAKHKKSVQCEVTKDGKTETKKVSAQKCTELGGKVLEKAQKSGKK